jgi:hypothetical protein
LKEEVFEQVLFEKANSHNYSNGHTTNHGVKEFNGCAVANGNKGAVRRKEVSFKHQLTFEYLLRHVTYITLLLHRRMLWKYDFRVYICLQEESIHLSESASFSIDGIGSILDPFEMNEILFNKKDKKRKQCTVCRIHSSDVMVDDAVYA